MRNIIDATRQDFSYAWRVLKRSPGFTFFAMLTIALGLGANAAIFSLVDGVLLKSIGYPEPERIVQLWEKPPRGLRNGIAGRELHRLDQAEPVVRGDGGTDRRDDELRRELGDGGDRRRAAVAARDDRSPRPTSTSSARKAALGRTFARDEDQPGKEKVVVLSHRLWLNLFGADPAMVGRDHPAERQAVHGDRRAAGQQRVRSAGGGSLDPAGVSAERRRATITISARSRG